MKLLQTQKNQVYELIEEAGLSPSMFLFDDPSEPDGTTYLRFKKTDYRFDFANGRGGGHFARYLPGYDTPYEDQSAGSWVAQLVNVRQWLKYLIRELKAPNKWKLLEEELRNFNFEDIKYTDAKFTHQEYKLLEKRIGEFKNKISKLDLLDEQIEKINLKLNHLLKLAENMNKIDWKELFIGSMMSLFIQLSIPPGAGQMIFGYLKILFVQFLPGK